MQLSRRHSHSTKSFKEKDPISRLRSITSQIQTMNKNEIINNLRKSTKQIQTMNKQHSRETAWLKTTTYVIVSVLVIASVVGLSIFIKNSLDKRKVSGIKTSDIKSKLMSKEEWKIFTSWIRTLPRYRIRESFTQIPKYDVFDIRSILPPVKNQGTCGSCAIYSLVGMMSDMYSRQQNCVIDLSSQYIINCLYDCANKKKLSVNQPCQGNSIVLLSEFFMQSNPLPEERACPNGTVLESCVSTNECIDPSDTEKLLSLKCPTKCTVSSDMNPKHFYIKEAYQLSFTDANYSISEKISILKDLLITYGSIGIAVFLPSDDYTRMLKEDPFIPSIPNEKDELFGHGMVLIGWRNDTWIIRNSWGTCDPLYGYVYWKMANGLEDCDLYVLEI